MCAQGGSGRKAWEEGREEILRAAPARIPPDKLDLLLASGQGKHLPFHPLSRHVLSPYSGPDEAGRQVRRSWEASETWSLEVHSPLEETDESNHNYNVNLHFLSALQPG